MFTTLFRRIAVPFVLCASFAATTAIASAQDNGQTTPASSTSATAASTPATSAPGPDDSRALTPAQMQMAYDQWIEQRSDLTPAVDHTP